ncbi:chemotaxis protein CheW [Zavarzinia sp. CC-PAN008]|uniref:chemotaxis protein CheW n=1 Tax=Zavarzinia sp. CC-PAN008 TaxID=3243332 RepID=UPI003F742D6F
MATAIQERKDRARAEHSQYVTMTVADRLLGLPILEVHDIVVPEKIARVPLAQPEVAGLINLRGKIVSAIDMRHVLRAPPAAADARRVGVTVSHKGETYTLLVDGVGEVVEIDPDTREPNPPTLDGRWKHLSNGVVRLEQGLLVLLNTDRVMDQDIRG